MLVQVLWRLLNLIALLTGCEKEYMQHVSGKAISQSAAMNATFPLLQMMHDHSCGLPSSLTGKPGTVQCICDRQSSCTINCEIEHCGLLTAAPPNCQL